MYIAAGNEFTTARKIDNRAVFVHTVDAFVFTHIELSTANTNESGSLAKAVWSMGVTLERICNDPVVI